MATAFSRSMRSLDADRFRSLILALLLVVALLGPWVGWFFLARIAVYELSEVARLEGASTIVAEFSPEALVRVQPGQPAQLRLDAFPWTQYGTVSATVANVFSEIHDGRVLVELAIHPDPASAIPLQPGLTGLVEVEVDRLSPALLVLRAASIMLNAPPVSATLEGE